MPDWIAPHSLGQQQFEARCAALVAASALGAGGSHRTTPEAVRYLAEDSERWLLRPVDTPQGGTP